MSRTAQARRRTGQRSRAKAHANAARPAYPPREYVRARAAISTVSAPIATRRFRPVRSTASSAVAPIPTSRKLARTFGLPKVPWIRVRIAPAKAWLSQYAGVAAPLAY